MMSKDVMNGGNGTRNYHDNASGSQLNTLNGGDYANASQANHSPDVIRNAKGLANIS